MNETSPASELRKAVERPANATAGRIVRGTAAYSVAMILQRAVTFLLLPFFAGILSPAEFGQIGVLTTLAAVLSVIVSLGLETAVFRGYLRARSEPAGPDVFINTLVGFTTVVPLAAVVVFALLGAAPLAGALEVSTDAMILAALGAALMSSATLGPLTILRAQERLSGYLQLTGLQVVVVPVLTIGFVALANLGATGWMLAYAIGAGVLLVRGLLIMEHRCSLRVESSYLRTALKFGVPLLPHGLAHWGLSVSDRAILAAFVPAAVVGEYYVAYLFSLPISLVAIAFSQATQPLFAEAIDAPERTTELGRIATIHAIVLVLLACGIALLGPPLVLLVFPPGYSGAAPYIPWLAAGTCLFGLYLLPMNAISVLAGRTERVWMITVVAALTNIALNLALVPAAGASAAAIDTTIGYAVLLAGVFVYSQRVSESPVQYEALRIAQGLVLITVPAIGAAALSPDESLTGLAVRIALLLVIGLALLGGPFRPEARITWKLLRPRITGSQA